MQTQASPTKARKPSIAATLGAALAQATQPAAPKAAKPPKASKPAKPSAQPAAPAPVVAQPAAPAPVVAQPAPAAAAAAAQPSYSPNNFKHPRIVVYGVWAATGKRKSRGFTATGQSYAQACAMLQANLAQYTQGFSTVVRTYVLGAAGTPQARAVRGPNSRTAGQAPATKPAARSPQPAAL